GVLMINSSQSSDQPDKTQTQKIYISLDRMRFEDESGYIAIFRQDKKVFWMLDDQKKTYTEMTERDLQEMKRTLDEASRQMAEQMKDLPPEQRQMMEAMMAGKMTQKAPEIVYQKVASGERIGSWVCDKYEGSSEGKKKSEVWTTDWQQLDLKSSDFQVLKEMGEFFARLAPEATSFYPMEESSEKSVYSGVPVKTISYSDDMASRTSELKELRTEEFNAALFELPAEYKKEALGMQP
ncbi:MAG: DUF4412 domain-containing protein, partial [bacterium]